MHTYLMAIPEAHPWLWPVLQGLGVLSLSGFLALWGAFLSFPPDVVVDGIDDVSKSYNSQSKLKLKNLGRLPAQEFSAVGRDVSFSIGGMTMDDCALGYGPSVSSRLAYSEITSIPILDFLSMDIPADSSFARFSMTLRVEYSTRLIFFTKSFAKEWGIELKQRPDGYTWNIKNK